MSCLGLTRKRNPTRDLTTAAGLRQKTGAPIAFSHIPFCTKTSPSVPGTAAKFPSISVFLPFFNRSIMVPRKTVKRLGTTRSAFARRALQEALKKLSISDLERRHREGYARKPVRPGEFSAWATEQIWGDE
jgi:hypothetical protein